MSGSTVRGFAAVLIGMTLGATAAGGTALLLYTGQGFLRAVGLLISSTIMAVAAGVWAGAPDEESAGTPPRTGGRWLALVLALIAGGAFAVMWQLRAPLRELAFGGAMAVLLILALPAYLAGALLAGIQARDSAGGGVAATMALAGVAVGVLFATTALIQNLEPYGIYYGAAAMLTIMSMIEPRAPARGDRSGTMDHVTLITGVGSAGQLGYTVAQRFLSAGARVVITARTAEIERLAAGLDSPAVSAIRADLLDDGDVERLVAAVRERHGRLDSLINVAGGLTLVKPLAETSAEEWQQELQRNAETALRMCRAALPLLRASRGAIVNFASPAGERAVANLGAYSAAKAGVIALTRALALEEKAHGVRVNAVAPGTVDTEQNLRSAAEQVARAAGKAAAASADALPTFVSRDDVAAVVLFLAGPDARGVSGETVHVQAPRFE